MSSRFYRVAGVVVVGYCVAVGFATAALAWPPVVVTKTYPGYSSTKTYYSAPAYYKPYYKPYYNPYYNPYYKPYIYPVYSNPSVVVVPKYIPVPDPIVTGYLPPNVPLNAAADAADVPQQVGNGILIRNLAANQAEVRFLVGSRAVSLAPGMSQRVYQPNYRSIRFDRGQDNGEAFYNLRDGTYAFVITNQGWELHRQTFSVTIDNSQNQRNFSYLIDTRRSLALSGRARTYTSDYPIEVRFDRGDGQVATKRFGIENSIVNVAINPQDGLLDLTPIGASPDQVAGGAVPTNSTKAPAQVPIQTSTTVSENPPTADSAASVPPNSAGLVAPNVAGS